MSPSELWGRKPLYSCLQASIFSFAPSKERNQFTFRHSPEEAAVEGLDKGVIRGFAGPGEVLRHFVYISPPIQRLGDELTPVIYFDTLRHSAVLLL